MSGPKIVDIRLVQALQERQRRLARQRLQQLQIQWNAQRQRIQAAADAVNPMSDVVDIKAIEQSIAAMDQRLAKLGDEQSLDELVNRGAERLAFMDAELSRLQQQIKDGLLEARLRARSMQASVADLSARLQAAGLEQERQALVVAPSLNSLERAAKLLEFHDHEQGNHAFQQALVDLGVSATSRQLKSEMVDPERERIEQLLVQLELLDDGQLTADLRARFDELDADNNLSYRRMRLDSLALDISQALQRSNDLVIRHKILDELEAQLRVYDEVPPGLIIAITTHREERQEGTSIDDLRVAVDQWCQQEARRLDGEQIRKIVLGSLQQLGYDVREGMASGWVEGGSIVLHKAGSNDYGFELQDLNGRLRSQVVRFGDPTASVSAQQQKRDTEIEHQWCTDHAQALDNLRQQGMDAEIMAKRDPGEVPMVVLRTAEGDLISREAGLNNLLKNQRTHDAR
jgi:hypothetical protein